MLHIPTRFLLLSLCIYGTRDDIYPLPYREWLEAQASTQFQYLTVIGLRLTVYVLCLGILTRISNTILSRRVGILHSLYVQLLCIAIPLEILITTVFWTLFFIDPKLILSDVLYKNVGLNIIPNICMHGVPIISLIHETRYVMLKRSRSHHIMLGCLAATYYLMCRVIASKQKQWPYPFLDRMSETSRVLVFVLLTSATLVCYEAFFYAHLKRRFFRSTNFLFFMRKNTSKDQKLETEGKSTDGKRNLSIQ